MEAPLALYRRYRPETYAEVIGQSHVTEPLQQALRNNRVHHAYLFSGPRGCGKTTSARILARCLNCEKGPTPEPCGSCQSCRDLARGGPGSIDVIEIDAASHGGVDDARELRERAFFSPVASRYKIYIVDEAHMVTTQGFNALLKLVEEPPEHLKFVFATTEPNKVIGTIRSRTHHYPFRLVPPRLLQDYLADLCTQEGVEVDPGALPLVVRAGGGSVRDTLSVLDQLIGGAGDDGVTYTRAVSLLGYTHDALLDEVIDAFAAGDGGSVFGVVDKVIESGQDPRRFAEDLLRRLRDLVIISAVPDAAARGLLEGPPDQAERFAGQAARLGPGELTRAAEVVNAGLTEMRGATAPRLHLELICARVLLPGSGDTDQGIHARLDRLERRLSIVGTPGADGGSTGGSTGDRGATAPSGGAPTPRTEDEPAQRRRSRRSEAERPTGEPEASTTEAATGQPTGSATRRSASRPAAPVPASESPASTAGTAAADPRDFAPAEVAAPAPSAAAEAPPSAPAPVESGALGLGDIRRLWPDILEAVKNIRRFTWVMLSQNAQVSDLHDSTLTIGLTNAGARDSFGRSGSDEVLRQALRDVLGVDWRIDAVVDPTATGGGPPSAGPSRGVPSGGGSAGGGSAGGGSAGGGRPVEVRPVEVRPVEVRPERARLAAPRLRVGKRTRARLAAARREALALGPRTGGRTSVRPRGGLIGRQAPRLNPRREETPAPSSGVRSRSPRPARSPPTMIDRPSPSPPVREGESAPVVGALAVRHHEGHRPRDAMTLTGTSIPIRMGPSPTHPPPTPTCWPGSSAPRSSRNAPPSRARLVVRAGQAAPYPRPPAGRGTHACRPRDATPVRLRAAVRMPLTALDHLTSYGTRG